MMSKYGNLGLARQECSLPLMKVQRDCSLTGQGLLGRRGTTQQQQQQLPQAWGAPWKSDGETEGAKVELLDPHVALLQGTYLHCSPLQVLAAALKAGSSTVVNWAAVPPHLSSCFWLCSREAR